MRSPDSKESWEGPLGFGEGRGVGWGTAGAVGAEEGWWGGRWCLQGQHPFGRDLPGAHLCPGPEVDLGKLR